MKYKQTKLNNIIKPEDVKSHRVSGRGHGSTRGCKSGRGNNGQKSRSGANKPSTEGGQYPSYLRWNKVGFKSKRIRPAIIKTSDLDIISSKINNSNVVLEDIVVHTSTNKKEKIKVLFDKIPKFCTSCSVHFVSKKVLDHIKVNLIK